MSCSELPGEYMDILQGGGESGIVEAMDFWGQTTCLKSVPWLCASGSSLESRDRNACYRGAMKVTDNTHIASCIALGSVNQSSTLLYQNAFIIMVLYRYSAGHGLGYLDL